MDQVRPQDGKRRFGIDRAPLDWPADPHQTTSGGGQRVDPGQKQDTGDRIQARKGLTYEGPLQKPVLFSACQGFAGGCSVSV
jgi:hypothetical protein